MVVLEDKTVKGQSEDKAGKAGTRTKPGHADEAGTHKNRKSLKRHSGIPLQTGASAAVNLFP